MNMRANALVVFGLLVVVAGCNLLTPIVFVGEPKQKVLPEFDKLAHKRVAVLVWVDSATLFDYPYARFELAKYVTDKLDAEMAQRHLDVVMVDTADVDDFVQANMDEAMNPERVGREFGVDYVVFLELLRFQFRDPEAPQFLQGRLGASVAVYDMSVDPDIARRFELAPVDCVYPEGAPVLMTGTNGPVVREATYRLFAEQVARKFYEHEVAL